MKRVILATACALTIGAAWALAQTPAAPAAKPIKMRPGVGYYTVAQAARGKVKFEKECSDCHAAEPGKTPRVAAGGNLTSGFRAIAEKRHNNRPLYPSVYYYYRRVLEGEPGDDVDRVAPGDKLDIVAYLLQQNGFPPGPKELVADLAAMKGMYLDPGPGFEWLLNGRDLSGWGFNAGHLCEPKPKGCGETDPWPEIRAVDGEMVATGKRHTLIYTERKFRNYTFQMEQRFDRPWDDNPDLFNANAGVIVFMSNIKHWPDKYMLVDGRWYDFMNIQAPGFVDLKKTYDDDARRRALRPPNEWQDIEIVAKDGGLKAYLNGVLVSSVPEGTIPTPTSLGFQSQVIPTHWRHIRIKVED